MDNDRRNKMLNYLYYALGFDKVCSFMAYLVQTKNENNVIIERRYYQVRGR